MPCKIIGHGAESEEMDSFLFFSVPSVFTRCYWELTVIGEIK